MRTLKFLILYLLLVGFSPAEGADYPLAHHSLGKFFGGFDVRKVLSVQRSESALDVRATTLGLTGGGVEFSVRLHRSFLSEEEERIRIMKESASPLVQQEAFELEKERLLSVREDHTSFGFKLIGASLTYRERPNSIWTPSYKVEIRKKLDSRERRIKFDLAYPF